MSTTPSRKRRAEEDAETSGFFSRLFSSAKKPRTVERSTASTPLPRIQLSPPSVKSPAASRSNGISTNRLVPARTGLLPPVVPKQTVTSWKPPPDAAFTIGSFVPTAARRRRVPYKPESQTLVMKRKRDKQQTKAYTELDMSRILERNKQLFFPKPNAEATASFRMPTAQRKFGSNQTGSRVPSGAATKVSFEEQVQDKKHVSFDQAQTPAASNKPRLRRTQTPGMVMHSEGTTPSPTVPQTIGASRAGGSSTATSRLSSPQTRGSAKSSSLYEPRVPQAPKVASEDGPYELDGAIEADVALGKIFPTANVDVMAPTSLPDGPLVDYAPVRFKRKPKAKRQVAQTTFMPDADEEDNFGIENETKKVKQGEPGEKKKVLAEGWGNFGKNMFQSKDKWKCDTCQVFNEKLKNKCASCNADRPDADATKVADATTTAAAPASSSSFSFGVSAAKQDEKKSFSFGVSSPSAAPNEKPKGISFGVSSSATPAPAGIKFGVDNDKKEAATPPAAGGFGFGVAKNGGPKTPSANISFGVPSSEPPAKKTPTEVPVAPKTDVKPPAGGAKFNFGATPALSADAKPFQFGSGAPAPPKDGKPFQFGAPTPKANDDGDSRKKKRRSTEEESAPAAAPAAPAIKFGAPPADKQAATKPSVTFGATPAKPSESKPSFVFGAGATPAPATPAPPVTPGPTNGFGQSSTMHAGSTPAPPKATGGASFVFGAGGSTPAPAAPANSFGGASSGLPFAAASTPAAPAAAAAAFGTPGFGATPAATTPAAPATTFGATPAGGPFGGTPAGGFGKAAAPAGGFGASSTPAAPTGGFGASTTPAAPTGGFGASTPAASAGGFGASTPAAPVGGFGASTPAAPAPGGFGATPAPSGGFGAPAPAASGGFGAPAPAPGAFGTGPAAAPSSNFNFGSAAPVPAAGPGGFGAAPAPAGSFGATPATGTTSFGAAPAFGQAPAAAPFAPSTPAGGFGSGTPAPPAPGAGFGAPGGFVSGAPAPSASGFGGGSSFGAGAMSTPNTGGGFNIGTGGAKSTGRRRIVRAKRPPGSSHR